MATDMVNQQSWQLMPSNGNKFAKNWHFDLPKPNF
jgi:hypothetical protein